MLIVSTCAHITTLLPRINFVCHPHFSAGDDADAVGVRITE